MMYNDEKIVDDATAERLAVAYSALMAAARDGRVVENATSPQSVEELLGAILQEIRAVRRELSQQKRIRLEF